MSRTRDGRFEIVYARRDSDSYMHSYSSEHWSVMSLEIDEEIESFGGTWDADASGSRPSGVASATFDPAEQAVIATHHDGTVERVELPVDYRVAGDALVLIYRDGREAHRMLVPESSEAYGAVVSSAERELLALLESDARERLARIAAKLAARDA